MKLLKIQISALLLISACLILPHQARAQWKFGASYQIRNKSPKKGFGFRLQRRILKVIPVVDLGLRAHFSYFNATNNISKSGVSVSRKLTFYDYGVDAVGGIPLGLLEPYVGMGIGANKYTIKHENSGSRFFWNSFVGTSLTLIPVLHPFIEYRFIPTKSPRFARNYNIDSHGRLILGLTLSF